MNLKYLIITGIICLFPVYSLAGECRDTGVSTASGNGTKELVLHFRFDRSLVDSGYGNNREALSALHELFSDSLCVLRIDSIRIRAYASPEGDAGYNRRLALRRARSVKSYLLWKYPGLNQHRLRTSSYTNKWAVLTAAVTDSDLPHREEVLGILSGNLSDSRKESLLKELHGGLVYRHLMRTLLPALRNASVCTVYMRALKHPVSELPAPLSLSGFSGLSCLSADSVHSADSCTQTPLHISVPSDKIPFPLAAAKRFSIRVPLLALKTNLLFDVALMPNFEVEVPIGKRWSLNGELMFPWWLMKDDKYCLQILMGGLEGRWWAGNRARREILTGHFLGLYAGGGKYDLQYDRNGYQGEFFIAAGVSYGYAHRIARNLRLEYSIGLGLLRTDYRHYHARDQYQTLLWQENGRYTWLGPTKAKISLVWMLNRKKVITNP